MSMPLERTYIGPEAMVNGLRSFHAEFPDGKGEILELYVDGDVVIVEWRMGGTQAETKTSFSRRGCSVAQVRGGKIVSYRDYFDRLSQREQLGGNPEPVPSALQAAARRSAPRPALPGSVHRRARATSHRAPRASRRHRRLRA